MATAEWLPAATLGAGVLGTIGGQGLTAWWASKREDIARQAERQVARDAVQRETLLELQDALLEMVRLAGQLHLDHRRVFSETKRWSRDAEPEELAEAFRLAVARVGRLKQRVLNDELRSSIDSIKRRCAEVTLPNTGMPDAAMAEQAAEAWRSLVSENQAVEDHLGHILRSVL